MSELEDLTRQAKDLEDETHLLRIETEKKLRRTTKEFRVLFGMIAVLLVVVLGLSLGVHAQTQRNAELSAINQEVLEKVSSVVDPDGERSIESRERTESLIQMLIENQDENTQAVLDRLDELEGED